MLSGLEIQIWKYEHIDDRKTNGPMELPADGMLRKKRNGLQTPKRQQSSL